MIVILNKVSLLLSIVYSSLTDMKHLLYLSLILPFTLFSAPSKLNEYYKYIDSAELKIVENNFSKALQYYYKANKIRPMFGVDLKNAAIAAAKIDNLDDVLYFSKKLLEKGYDIENFNTPKSNLNKYYKEIKNHCQSIKILSSIIPEYRDILISMVNADQKFLNTKENRNLFKDSIDAIFAANAKKLLSLIAVYGFPSEERVGINEEGDPAVIFIHQRGGEKNTVVNFSGVLKTAVLKGECYNKSGALLIENAEAKQGRIYNCISLMRGSYDTFIYVNNPNEHFVKKDTTFFTKWGAESISDSTKNKFDERRAELFLDSVDNSYKKAVYQIQHPEFSLGNRDSGLTIKWNNYSNFLYMYNNFDK